MLFLFAFFLGGFPLLDVVLNFISLHPDVPGILRLYGQSLFRLTGISVASTGVLVHRNVPVSI